MKSGDLRSRENFKHEYGNRTVPIASGLPERRSLCNEWCLSTFWITGEEWKKGDNGLGAGWRYETLAGDWGDGLHEHYVSRCSSMVGLDSVVRRRCVQPNKHQDGCFFDELKFHRARDLG